MNLTAELWHSFNVARNNLNPRERQAARCEIGLYLRSDNTDDILKSTARGMLRYLARREAMWNSGRAA